MAEGKNSLLLVYDGDCGICTEWVAYWKQLTGNRVQYRPYQEVQHAYPQIPQQEFENAIQLLDAGKVVASGAGAAFYLYRVHPLLKLLYTCYTCLPGFAALSERVYSFFSRHRGLLRRITHLCWGKNHLPAEYRLSSQLFLHLLGCIYFTAFFSLSGQITGLAGSEGLLPLELFLQQLEQVYADSKYWKAPGLFWLWSSDFSLRFFCFAGMLLSAFLVLRPGSRTVLLLLYLLYLSLVYAGQSFMTFQWDLLLLESGFLALFLHSGSSLIICLYRWLVFRFMFMGGLVKLLSGDPTWDNLTALFYHFETQPLPSPLSWYAHHLPDSILKGGVFFTFLVELLVPFLVFAPRRFRFVAAWLFILLQGVIILTGNYNFFNLLTICLCLFLFDDAALRAILPNKVCRIAGRTMLSANSWYRYGLYLVSVLVVLVSCEQMLRYIKQNDSVLTPLSELVAPLRIVQNYGPFAVMTTVRREIIIEGSNDGVSWREYQLPYKPGNTGRRPAWVLPHQPRLDWQMWFAALSPPEKNPWFEILLYRLLTGSHPVLELFDGNPFPDKAPVLVRARFYEYRFTTPEQKAETGDWWTRRYIMDYSSPRKLTTRAGN